MPVELHQDKSVKISDNWSIAYGAWGKPVSNRDLINNFFSNSEGSELDKAEAFLNATGFVRRYHPIEPAAFLDNTDKIGPEMVEVGSRLTKRVMQMNGWDSVDCLIITTSTPPDREGFWGEEIAQRSGISRGSIRFSYLACDGAIAGLLDTLKDESLANSRIVITSVEPLGYLVNPTNFKDAAIFGNGAASTAFKQDDIQLFNGKTVVEQDKKGVICSPKTYALPDQPEAIPSHYETNGNYQDIFACDRKGVFLLLPEPQTLNSPYMEMDGLMTARYFARAVPPVVRDVLSTYYQQHDKDGLIKLSISHQPSKGVKEISGARLAKLLKEENMPEVHIPWVMDQVGMGNSSSATTLIALGELGTRVDLRHPFNITAYGIGSAITSMNLQIKR